MTRLLVGALLVFISTPVTAQTTVAIRLRVSALENAEPIRRARITGTNDIDASPLFSAEDGSVSVTAPAGTDLRVSKAGYAPRVVRVPSTPATLDVRMAAAAVITGRVIDSNGAPAVRVSVIVSRVETRDSAAPGQVKVHTDDRGEFRAGGLAGGVYQVYTERGVNMAGVLDNLPAGGAPAAMAERVRQGREAASNVVTVTADAGQHADVTLTHPVPSIEFPFSEGGVISGTIRDEFGEPAEGMRVTLMATGTAGSSHMSVGAVADDMGRFRLYQLEPARYLLVVTEPNSSSPLGGVYIPGPNAALSSRLPVYYPGTTNPSEATSLAVERGREMAGMDMVVRATRGVRVFGTVTPVPGATQRPVSLKPSVPWTVIALGNRTAAVTADGAFELTNVPPGEYALQGLAMTPAAGQGLAANFRFASVRITVGPNDVGPIVMTPYPTSSISGRITLDGGGQGLTANQFQLSILPVDTLDSPEPYQIGGDLRVRGAVMIQGGVEPDSDWTFRIDGLSSPTRFGLARAAAGWWIKEVRVGGRNAVFEPAPFGAPEDSRNDVEVVLSNRGGVLAGNVTDGDDKPVELYTVAVFPADRERWFKGSPLVKTTTSRSDGTFILPSLAPGEYLISAVEFSEVDPNADDLLQPEGLARLAPSARRVTVAEGQRHRVDLRLTPLPR